MVFWASSWIHFYICICQFDICSSSHTQNTYSKIRNWIRHVHICCSYFLHIFLELMKISYWLRVICPNAYFFSLNDLIGPVCRDRSHIYMKEHQKRRQLYGSLLTMRCKSIGSKHQLLCYVVELELVDKIWASSTISFTHVSFWCSFIDPHLITHQTIIGVCVRWVIELDLSYMQGLNWWP